MMTGHEVKAARIAAKLSQQVVADEISVSQQYYSKMENSEVLSNKAGEEVLNAINKLKKNEP